MARIVKEFKDAKGRDKGKTFVLTEMAPRVGHSWATRALFAIMNAGVEIDDTVLSSGMVGLSTIAMDIMQAVGKIPAEVGEPLMNELLQCVQSQQEKGVRALTDDDIEEIATFFALQKEVLMMHISPFTSGDLSTSESPTKEAPQVA